VFEGEEELGKGDEGFQHETSDFVLGVADYGRNGG
jgi:hypothetical protein